MWSKNPKFGVSIEYSKFRRMKILSIEKSQILRKSQVWSENPKFGAV